MAQSHMLLPEGSFEDIYLLRHSRTQSQADNQYYLHTSGNFYRPNIFTDGQAMTQPQPSEHMARNYMQHQGWHLRAGSSLDYRQSTDAQSNYSFSSGVSSQNHLWGTNSSSEITDWNQVLSTEPVIATDSTYHDLRNDDLKYPHIAARDIADNNPDSFRGYESMLPSGLCEVVHRKSVNGSELELNSSLSATTHPEQTLKSDSYSPGPMPDPASLSGDWNSSSTFSTPIGGISPYSVSSSLYLDTLSPLLSKSTLGTYASDHSESLGMKALFIPNTRTTHNGNDLPVAHLQARCAGYEPSSTHNNSISDPVWSLRRYSRYLLDSPSNSRGPQLKVVRNDEPASVSSSHNNGSVQGSWAKSHTSIHFHPSFNETLQIPRTVDAQAQRKQNDDLLIQGKKEGLTYKEIRKRMVGQKPAESTLRGRYRSLTKQRKDRVRKPIWTPHDIKLLNEFVHREFDRIDASAPCPQAISREQKLTKVAWKKVAKHINEEGGSYHFGNSTCKRKWLDINKCL